MRDDTGQLIQQLLKGAGAIIMKKYGKIGVHHTKNGPTDVVTEADLEANEYIISGIKKKYPDHNIISEETEREDLRSPYTWIIDPLDGTLNFSKGIPLFATMVAFAEHGVVTASGIYDPVHDTMYVATRGGGAFVNGEKMRCSEESDFEKTVGVCSARRAFQLFTREKLGRLRTVCLWCAGLSGAWTASGKRDWWFEEQSHGGPSLWDLAPASLLLEEAGCLVTDKLGQPWTLTSESILAANPELHRKLTALLQL